MSKSKKKGKNRKLRKYSPRNIQNIKLRYLSYTLIIITVLVLGTFMVYCIAPDGVVKTAASEPITYLFGFSQQLYVAGDGNPRLPESNVVMFPYSLLNHQSSNETAAIFEDVYQNVSAIYRELPGSGWEHFIPGEESNHFTTIDPYVTYYVMVTSDCMLTLDPYYVSQE